jgi:hypothetical protein
MDFLFDELVAFDLEVFGDMGFWVSVGLVCEMSIGILIEGWVFGGFWFWCESYGINVMLISVFSFSSFVGDILWVTVDSYIFLFIGACRA